MFRSIYWLIRRKVAEKNQDDLILKANYMTSIYSPLLLQLFGLEVILIKYTNPEHNPFTGTNPYWMIRPKSNLFDMSKQFNVWRIQSRKNKPTVVWLKAEK